MNDGKAQDLETKEINHLLFQEALKKGDEIDFLKNKVDLINLTLDKHPYISKDTKLQESVKEITNRMNDWKNTITIMNLFYTFTHICSKMLSRCSKIPYRGNRRRHL